MNDASTFADRLRRTVTGPMWHGQALGELLADVTAAEATEKPVASTHSIWELVLHITTWARVPLERLKGTGREDPTEEEDWPDLPARGGEKAWADARRDLAQAYEALAAAAATLPQDALTRQVAKRGYDVATMLSGVVEHGTYHGGQIALLKRTIRGDAP